MNRYLFPVIAAISGFYLSTPGLVIADSVLYEQGFESGEMQISAPEPVWSIMSGASGIGPGNLFEVVSNVAHTGRYSLRFNYDGRNGLCNTCGAISRIQQSDASSVDYFVDSEHGDLTLDPIYASADRIVYNITGGYSKWRITSVASENALNDKLVLEILADSISGGSSTFSANDKVDISRACGVDGLISGNNINRRRDCDQAITYMDGVSQDPGTSIFRRIYLRIGSGAVPPTGQKLRYWKSSNGPLYSGFGIDAETGLINPWVIASNVGGSLYPIYPGILFQYDTWYYFEEEFKAESSKSANDGEYRLWIAESGKDVEGPVVELVELDLGPVISASLWGNHQHSADSHGYWYIDDFKIAKVRVGPEDGTSSPMPPIISGN